MAQVPTGGNYVVDNSTGANVRADINEIYDAILTMNSGGSAPSYAKSYTFWADTTAGIMKMRNGANNAFINLFTLAGGIDVDAASNFNEDVTFTTANGNNIVFDKSDQSLEFGDDTFAKFGAGGDLSITHTGSRSEIHSITGDLIIRSDSLKVNNAGNSEEMARFTANGAAELYFDNSKKFETTSDGILTQGTILHKGAEGGDSQIRMEADEGDDLADRWRLVAKTDGTFNLQNLASGTYEKNISATGNGNVEIYHNNGKVFSTESNGIQVLANEGLSAFLRLYADEGDDNADQYWLKTEQDGTGFHIQNNVSGSTETNFKTVGNGAVELYFDNSKKFQTTSIGNRIPDDVYLGFGNSDDLNIRFLNGSGAFLQSGGNSMFIRSNLIELGDNSGHKYIKCIDAGAVELYHGVDSKKLETTSSGINVIGSINVNGSALSTGGGKILQVIQTMKKDTFSSSSSSFVDVTGLSVTITPSATTSKILVMTFVNYAHSSENRTNARVVRVVGSSEFGIGEADSAGNRVRSQFIGRHAALNGASNAVPIQILDSPSTTSACTYKFQFSMIDGGTGQINFGQNDSDSSSHARGISTIIVMEVSA